MDEKFVVHFWSTFPFFFYCDGGDGYGLIVHTVGQTGCRRRVAGKRKGGGRVQSVKAVKVSKTALGCVETGFVDSVRR